MFVAMNHFRVAEGKGDVFEATWRERKSYLHEVPGFIQFHLVKGKDAADGSHAYASHVIWDTKQAFLDWTHSEAFKKAHGQKRMPEDVLLGHPQFKGWEAVDL